MARTRELTNALADMNRGVIGGNAVFRFGIATVAQLINPLTPHLSEEIWASLGYTTILTETSWPSFDPALLEDDTVTVGVQVNGKLRGTIELPRDTGEADARSAALALPNVSKLMGDRTPRQVIVVPNRIINVVL